MADVCGLVKGPVPERTLGRILLALFVVVGAKQIFVLFQLEPKVGTIDTEANLSICVVRVLAIRAQYGHRPLMFHVHYLIFPDIFNGRVQRVFLVTMIVIVIVAIIMIIIMIVAIIMIIIMIMVVAMIVVVIVAVIMLAMTCMPIACCKAEAAEQNQPHGRAR
jgi:hypothetical protein